MVKIALAFEAVVTVAVIFEHVRVSVAGLYDNEVFVNAFVVPAPVANSNGKLVLSVDSVIPIFVAFVAVFDVVALPDREPEKVVAVRISVNGLYDNEVFVNAFVVPAPVANSNGKLVLAVDRVIPIFVADEALPVNEPTKMVDVNVPEFGLYVNGPVVSST